MSTQTPRTDEAARREFWTYHMERSFKLQQAMAERPVAECSEGFASIPDAAEEAGVPMLFSDSKIAGDLNRIFYIRQGIVPDLINIAKDMRERGDPQDRRRIPHARNANPARSETDRVRHDCQNMAVGKRR